MAKEEVISYSTHHTRWLLRKAPGELSEREAASVAMLTQLCPPVPDVQRLLSTFRAILTQRHRTCLDPW